MAAPSRSDKTGRHEFGAPKIHLPPLLLLVSLAELMIYRLLVPALRPRIDQPPPSWHTLLTYAGLYLFYFASLLAAGVVARQLWEIASGKDRYHRLVSPILVLFGGMFVGLACLSIVTPPSARVTFLLEGSFVTSLVALVIGQWLRPGDLGVAIGQLVMALPLLLHFYTPLSVHYFDGAEALFNGLAEQVEHAGRWLMLGAALSMPYFFGARPFLLRAARLPPLVVSILVIILATSILRHDYVTGMAIAQNGLGVALGPAAPASMIVLSWLGLAAVAWTFTNCITSSSSQRRSIGVGLALIVSGGYSFSWPLQYLTGLAGFLTIARAASRVSAEEVVPPAPAVPSIEGEVWQAYLCAVVGRLGEQIADCREESISLLSVKGEGARVRSLLVFESQNTSVKVTVEREAGAIVGLDVRCGTGEVTGPPCWSICATEPDDAGRVHPAAPATSERRNSAHLTAPDPYCPSLAVGFALRDGKGWSETLLACERGDKLAQLMPGWVACWPSGVLRSQIYPGRGAPLNTPIPVVSMAMDNLPGDVEPLVSLLLLLVELAHEGQSLVNLDIQTKEHS